VGIGLSQIKHVKLPVADLRRSASWYRALFDLELVAEYVEQGEVRGVSLLDRDGGFEIVLRQREYCAGQPRLAGFDVFALRSPTEELLTTVAERCDRLGIQRTEVRSYPGYGAGFDIPDPGRNVGSDRLARPAGPVRLSRGGIRRRRAATAVPPATAGSRRSAQVAVSLVVVRAEHGAGPHHDSASKTVRPRNSPGRDHRSADHSIDPHVDLDVLVLQQDPF
jgi:catechol 2,3-dioxygenase-like lactoylglutathione lyase family enzyme